MLHTSLIIYTGLILPHDYYGTHLDDNGNTIDQQLEVRNFKRAGELDKQRIFISLSLLFFNFQF